MAPTIITDPVPMHLCSRPFQPPAHAHHTILLILQTTIRVFPAEVGIILHLHGTSELMARCPCCRITKSQRELPFSLRSTRGYCHNMSGLLSLLVFVLISPPASSKLRQAKLVMTRQAGFVKMLVWRRTGGTTLLRYSL